MANKLVFRGGIEKVFEGTKEEQTYKFFLFVILKDKELIYFEALKYGLLKRDAVSTDDDSYVVFTPEVKIFTSSQGFGVRKSYHSFFFKFDSHAKNNITICPFGPNRRDFIFKARGRFMTTDEITNRYGDDSQTYGFYKRQTYLSKSELRKYVSIGQDANDNISVRVLRV